MIEQRSEAWHAARSGMLTASLFPTIMSAGPRGMASLAAEVRRLMDGGKPKSFRSKPTDWGKTHEAQACALFALMEGLDVTPCGLLLHPEHFFVGASCDGLIADWGCIEIKNPYNPQVHLDTLLYGMPDKNRAQVQGEMWVSGRGVNYFISFDPRLLDSDDWRRALYVERIERNDYYISKLEKKVLYLWSLIRSGEAPRAHDILSDGVPNLF